jgi:hypothetical protein
MYEALRPKSISKDASEYVLGLTYCNKGCSHVYRINPALD